MERHIKKEDIYVVLALLAHVAESRERNMKEIWNLPNRKLTPPDVWTDSSHDLIVSQRTRMNDEIYAILTSEVMKMKYPAIKKIENKDITIINKIGLILLLMGMPVNIISSILIVSTANIRSLIEQYPEIFR